MLWQIVIKFNGVVKTFVDKVKYYWNVFNAFTFISITKKSKINAIAFLKNKLVFTYEDELENIAPIIISFTLNLLNNILNIPYRIIEFRKVKLCWIPNPKR